MKSKARAIFGFLERINTGYRNLCGSPLWENVCEHIFFGDSLNIISDLLFSESPKKTPTVLEIDLLYQVDDDEETANRLWLALWDLQEQYPEIIQELDTDGSTIHCGVKLDGMKSWIHFYFKLYY